MRVAHDLGGLDWRLTGWFPDYWRGTVSMEQGLRLDPDVPAVPVRVPGSVQQALREAGLLPDWNQELNTRLCEWVEHRHWVYQATLPAEWTRPPGRKLLQCDGLDYQGVILVNGREAGAFRGTHVPHVFDLTDHLGDAPAELALVFTGAPGFLGQIGWTSRIAEWKVRFNYLWDWQPRLVQIGVWDRLRLAVDQGDALEELSLYTDWDLADERGQVHLSARLRVADGERQVEVALQDASGEVVRRRFAAVPDFSAVLDGLAVHPWHPSGNGPQVLYRVEVRLLDRSGQVLDQEFRQVGFRQIRWQPCHGAPAGADPWICRVNGTDTFLQGFNWVPVRPLFADVTEELYRQRLETYRDLGTNLLRVWGGAVLEKECFYRLCDELGILVWQEFPLSSSGIDNWPPEDPRLIEEMRGIARSYVVRRQHHPSLLMWCGGNELQGGLDGSKQGAGKPVGLEHPMMAAQAEVVARLDPTRRFVPTSSSGPRFCATAEEFGKGVHWDVHGPWNHPGELEEWFRYWDQDDALFRSETGMPGCSPADLLRAFGQELAWPADKRANPYYRHVSPWWDQWADYLAQGGDPDRLEAYVTWSQDRQARALEYAARVCKGRFPAMGGILFWMGHDCFPCPINTAVIDYHGRPKPAAQAIARAFAEPTEG